MYMETLQLMMVLLWVVIATLILRALKNMPIADTKQEAKFLRENQARAVRQIKLCLTTLIVYIVYNFAYSYIIKVASPGCTDVFKDHKGMNNLLWFVSRGM